MKQPSFGNDFSLATSLKFFYRWRKALLLVLAIAFVVSLVASLLVTPRYKSSVVLFPTSSNRISKAILVDRYSLDFMDYGIERDCEYAIQILSSQSMMDDVCKRFNLMEHYGINPNAKDKYFQLAENYRGNVSVRRTEYLGVEVSVLDVDPQYAADIANFIAANYDTLCSRIHKARATDACEVMAGVCSRLEAEISSLEDSLGGLYNYSDYTNRMYQELAKQVSSGNMAAANRLRDEIASHKTMKGSYAGIDNLLESKRKELATLQTQLAERQTDLENEISYKFWLDEATPADKKAYPKRIIIVLLGTLASVVMCILVLLIMERWKTWSLSAKGE